LKNVTLRRTKDGYFAGSNFPVNPKLIAEETAFPVNDMGVSANARRLRWEKLLDEWKGRIDVKAGQRFLGDTVDSYTGQTGANERTLCGRIDLSPRGVESWMAPYAIGGAVQNKVVDSRMAQQMSFTAAYGPQCGGPFHAARHLARHPDNRWAAPYLRDMRAQPWTVFHAMGRQ
jgi:hypothetical protein